MIPGRRTVKISYNAGYSTIPADLEQSILVLVDHWYNSFDKHLWHQKSKGVEDQRIDYELDIPKTVTSTWDTYKKLVNA